MKLRIPLNKIVFAGFLTCGMIQSAIAAPPKYAVIDLGNFGMLNSSSAGINQFGHITGDSSTSDKIFQTILWNNGVLNNLIPENFHNQGVDINDSDQVVGWAEFDVGIPGRAFLWDNGTLFDLGTFGGKYSNANAINNLGQVVGISNYDPADPAGWRPFIWQNGVMRSLVPSCEICSGSANDINDAGEIVGSATTPDFASHAVLWDVNGAIHDLGALTQWAFSTARGINDSGQMVGDSYSHAVYWENENA